METQEQQTIVTPKKKKWKLLIILFFITAIFAGVYFFFLTGGSSSPTLKLIPYKSGDKWGYIDNEGKILINPQFNYANVFIDGIALVKSAEDKYGYIGEDGKYRINATFKDASSFSEGLACVVPENGKPQFIDDKGNVKFTVSTGEVCGIFNEGLAPVKIGEKWGYLDKTGKIKINAQFDYAYLFSDGLAAVAMTNKEKGETLWGFVNNKGDIAINYQFKNVGKFNSGLAIVYDGKKYGYIDKTGKYIINPQFDFAGEFKNDLAIIRQGSMCGYIDNTGKIIINPQFNTASSFSENGMASVSSSDRKYGYIDKDGKYIINPQFEYSSDFFNRIAFVKSSDKWGVIDEKGKYLINPQFDEINVDIERYKYKTVVSDYFDVNSIVEKFLEGTDQKSFRNLSSKTTIAELKKSFPNITVNNNSWEATSADNIVLNEHSLINNVSFTFSENPVLKQKPVYRTVQKYDYWKGNYSVQELDHYENIPNDNAKLQSVTFYFYLSSSKAIEKSEQIFKAILESWKGKVSVTYNTEIPYVFRSNYMTLMIAGYGMSSGNNAIYQVTF